MNWFRENRWLGTFLIAFGVCALLGLFFLFRAKGNSEDALARFNEAATERNRLENLDPYPTQENFRKMGDFLKNYAASLDKLKQDLRTQMLPAPALAPNEFQSHLRQSIVAVTDRAHTNKVKLPDNFALGFDEYTAALPSTAAAPLLGQELAQVELLLNLVIDARVDAVTALVRVPLPEEKPSPTPAPGGARKPVAAPTPAGPKMLERGVVDLTFASSPSAARKVLNQLGTSSQQLFITRTLHVRNEQEKGPVHEQTPAAGASPAAMPAAAPTKPAGALTFIVGNEHIETSARIELIRFTFQ
jgi:hypothetical protein